MKKTDGQEQRASISAFAALLLGAVGIGFAPICVRMVDLAPVASAAWRLSLATPILLALCLWLRPQSLFQRQDLSLMALAGMAFAADLGVWHYSIVYTSVANATLLANLAPVFIALWSLWFLRQKLSARYWLGLFLGLAGAATLVGASFGQAEALFGDALGMLTAVFYAVYQLAVAGARRSRDTLSVMTVSTMISALALAPFAIASGQWWPPSAQDWHWLLSLAVVSHILGQGLIAYAFAHLAPAFSSVALLLQPVAAAAFAWWLLAESIAATQALGAVVVLFGIALCRRYQR